MEESEEEKYRREYLEKKYEASRLKVAKKKRNTLLKYKLLRLYSIFSLVLSLSIITDYFLPEKKYTERVVNSYKQRTKYSSYRVIRTSSFGFLTPNSFWLAYEPEDMLNIYTSPIFTFIKHINIENARIHIETTPRSSIYSLLVWPIIVLIGSLALLANKNFNLVVYALGTASFIASIYLILCIW